MIASPPKYSYDYRYGFNGMEKDDEVSGEGNSYTTEFKQFDSRIGRWLSIDPVTHPHFSPYSAFDNNPISISDPVGQMENPKMLVIMRLNRLLMMILVWMKK